MLVLLRITALAIIVVASASVKAAEVAIGSCSVDFNCFARNVPVLYDPYNQLGKAKPLPPNCNSFFNNYRKVMTVAQKDCYGSTITVGHASCVSGAGPGQPLSQICPYA